jgi:putative membrane protein
VTQSLILFLSYLITAVLLLGVFVWVYARVTPYHEFQLIRENNSAAAVTLGGAMLGFSFPMMASIYYTQSLVEMMLWALITGLVQLGVFIALRRWAGQIEQGQIAPAILLASASIAVGLLNAVCISH